MSINRVVVPAGFPSVVEFWRAAVESCAAEPGDDTEFDLDALRRQARPLASDSDRSPAISHFRLLKPPPPVPSLRRHTLIPFRSLSSHPCSSSSAHRSQVRAEGVALSTAAAHVESIIREWEATKDDKTFAMKTRFFPSGVKIPGVKWTL